MNNKTPGQSNELDAVGKEAERKFYAVEYAGYWHIQEGQYYGDKDILNAEDVGSEQAEQNAKMIVEFLNKQVRTHIANL